jgi:hypothetical protein
MSIQYPRRTLPFAVAVILTATVVIVAKTVVPTVNPFDAAYVSASTNQSPAQNPFVRPSSIDTVGRAAATASPGGLSAP